MRTIPDKNTDISGLNTDAEAAPVEEEEEEEETTAAEEEQQPEKRFVCEATVISTDSESGAKTQIRVVCPKWIDGKHGEENLLRSAYWNALDLAVEHNCRSIGFPLLGDGVYGRTWTAALRACGDYLKQNTDVSLEIIFAAPETRIFNSGRYSLWGYTFPRYKLTENNTELDLDNENDEVQQAMLILGEDIRKIGGTYDLWEMYFYFDEVEPPDEADITEQIDITESIIRSKVQHAIDHPSGDVPATGPRYTDSFPSLLAERIMQTLNCFPAEQFVLDQQSWDKYEAVEGEWDSFWNDWEILSLIHILGKNDHWYLFSSSWQGRS